MPCFIHFKLGKKIQTKERNDTSGKKSNRGKKWQRLKCQHFSEWLWQMDTKHLQIYAYNIVFELYHITGMDEKEKKINLSYHFRNVYMPLKVLEVPWYWWYMKAILPGSGWQTVSACLFTAGLHKQEINMWDITTQTFKNWFWHSIILYGDSLTTKS